MLRWMLICLFTCLLSISYAQPVFEWATKTEGHDLFHRTWDMKVNGNAVLTTGHVAGTIDFDPGPGVYPLNGPGMYVTKWDTTGYLEWTVKIGGVDDHSRAIATDDKGNFYITGSYSGLTDFDPGPAYAHLDGGGGFIAKYGPFGDYLWVVGLATRGESIVVDNRANVYVTGRFFSTTDFDFGPDSTILASIGDDDAFIVKYNTNGKFRWVRQIGGANRDNGERITFDHRGKLYVSGIFRGIAYINPDSIIDTLISSSPADYNLFLAELDTSGNFIWVNSYECTGRQFSSGLTMDDKGNIYLSGVYNDTIDLDPGVGKSLYVEPPGVGEDTYLAKYNSDGDYLWGFTTGNGSVSRTPSIALDSFNNVYITGYLEGIMDLDPGPDSALIIAPGSNNAGFFMAKYDPSGNYVWAIPLNLNLISSIATDANTGIYMTGRMSGFDTTDFDPGPDTFLLMGGGNYDLFTAKYRSRTITDTVAVSICTGDSYTLGYRTYTETGTYYRTYPVRPGLDSMVVVELTVEAPDTSVTRPDHKTLQATNPQATYQWVDCDNGHTPIPGATAQAFIPAVNGTYAVVVTEAGCTDTSACYAVTSIGVDAGPAAVPLTVYPNPAREQVHLSFYLPEATNTTIRLYDFQGRAVFTKDLGHAAGHQVVTVPVGPLPAGMYQVLLRTEHGSAVRKVMVQR